MDITVSHCVNYYSPLIYLSEFKHIKLNSWKLLSFNDKRYYFKVIDNKVLKFSYLDGNITRTLTREFNKNYAFVFRFVFNIN